MSVLFAAAAFLHLHQLLGDRTYFRDTYLLYVPAKHYLAELLRRGEWPQWWPWDGLGCPFLAQPMFSVFHPTTLLYWLLPFWTAFAAQDVTGTLLALGGTYLLARALAQPRPAALLAACVYAGNGYVMALTEHTFMKLSAGTMPWYLWGLLLARRRGGRWLAAPALAMGCLLLAGDPQIALLSAGAGLVVAWAEQRSARSLFIAVASPAAGALLAAVQLLPSLRLAEETERATDMSAHSMWSLDLKHVVGMIVPLQTDGFIWHTELGVAVLALVAASTVSPRSRSTTALWVLVILSFWLALGDAWGLNAVVRHVVPVWGKLRYSLKSIIVAMLGFSLLAGEGLRLLSDPARARRARWVGALTALALAGGAALYLASHVPGSGWVYLRSFAPLAAAAVAALKFGGLAGWREWCAVGVVGAQALSFGVRALPVIDPAFYAESQLSPALRNAGVGLYGAAFDRLDTATLTPETTPFRVTRAGGGQHTSYGGMWGLPSLSFYMPGTALRYQRAWFTEEPSTAQFLRYAGIFGVGYLVESADMESAAASMVGGDRVIAREPDFGFAAVRLRQALPRAYAVRRARVVASPEEAGREIRETQFKPGREILVEGETPRPAWAARPDSPAVPAGIVSRSNNSIRISADLPWDGFVVLNETDFSGWTASVDGAPSPVLVANGFVRAVEAGAGHHEITFRYMTPGLRTGGVLSAMAWAALLLWIAVTRRRASTAAAVA